MPSEGSPRIEVYRSRREAACLEHATVLRLGGIECEVIASAGQYAVVVMEHDLERAERELEAYRLENASESKRAEAPPQRRRGGWVGALGYVVVVGAVAWLERASAFSLNWWDAGTARAGLILNGESWRTVTALCLHADARHLAGNLVFGALFGVIAARALGSGLAWFLILISGALGNAINAALRPPAHTSVGASTAAFAALGIIALLGWSRGRGARRAAERWAPFVAALVLLGYLGFGGARTDLIAHVAGFATGSAAGFLITRVNVEPMLGTKHQLAFGLATLAIVAASWYAALG